MYQEKIALNNPEEIQQKDPNACYNEYFDSPFRLFHESHQAALIDGLRKIYFTSHLGIYAVDQLTYGAAFSPVIAAIFDEAESTRLQRQKKTAGMVVMNLESANELVNAANFAATKIGFYCQRSNKDFRSSLERQIIYGVHKEKGAIGQPYLLSRQVIYRLDRRLYGQFEARRRLDQFINQNYKVDENFPKLFGVETALRSISMVKGPFTPERLMIAGDRGAEILADINMPPGLHEEIKVIVKEAISQLL